ncbi:MAG: glycosyltransferase family 9 protein [Crocinitomicaceae bacterium]|jgi:heptosyltransferase-2|tara:strand:- start:44389 stop:45363 length:975 start_codon:yes stop_codon:yes gene_type:complete
MQKILIIRFSSIGDLVLTSPIVRALKQQGGYCIHYLVKKKFKNAIENNPYIDQLFYLEDSNTKSDLTQQKYDIVVDLQNNLKSLKIRRGLAKKTLVVNKENIKKLLLVRTGIDLLKGEHIVGRYFKTVKEIGIKDDGKGLDFFIPEDFKITSFKIPIDLSQPYLAWVIGASYTKKMLPLNHIVEVCKGISLPILLLGGPMDRSNGDDIIASSNAANLYNLCGELSLEESSYVLKQSSIVLSNDTGLMHIAAAFQKKIISFWGCTKPSLGMSPFMANEHSAMLLSDTNKAPCSKLGNRCKSSKNGCIKDLSTNRIISNVNNLLQR